MIPKYPKAVKNRPVLLENRPVFILKTGQKPAGFLRNRLVFQFSDPPDPLKFKGILFLVELDFHHSTIPL
jgi:hypothetical protein